MTERLFGISYAFSEMPETKDISEKGYVEYSPIVVCYEQETDSLIKLQYPKPFRAYSKNMELYPGHQGYYRNLHSTARENQERLVADYICALILNKLRSNPDDHCVFIIKDAFESEKFVGRLGYLGLPLERVTLYFVSRDLKDMLTNYMSPYSLDGRNDLTVLQKYGQMIHGPFSEDEEITMLYTFYCTFEHRDLYPLRVNLFAQYMGRTALDHCKKEMEKYFFMPGMTAVCNIEGGRDSEKTRIPIVLMRCEEYVDQLKKKAVK